jgi:hypothetical protein
MIISQAQNAYFIAISGGYGAYRMCEPKLDMIGQIRLHFGRGRAISASV